MTADEDDKGPDEHTRIGVAPTPKLPGAPVPPKTAPPVSAGTPDEHTQLAAKPPPQIGPKPTPAGAAPKAAEPSAGTPDEHTQLAAKPPPQIGPRPTPAGAAPKTSPDESTRLATAPPPLPRPPAASSPVVTAPVAPPPPAAAPRVPPVAPAPTGGSGDFTEHTVLLAALQRPLATTARMQRLQPPGRSEIVTLDRTHYLVGRLPSCDLRLYSQTASREHAQLTTRDGRWYLVPVSGKVVLVNGTQVKEEVPLTHKMRLQLGGDELLFLDESGATAVAGPPAAAIALAGNRWLLYAVGALALLGALWLWVR